MWGIEYNPDSCEYRSRDVECKWGLWCAVVLSFSWKKVIITTSDWIPEDVSSRVHYNFLEKGSRDYTIKEKVWNV